MVREVDQYRANFAPSFAPTPDLRPTDYLGKKIHESKKGLSKYERRML